MEYAPDVCFECTFVISTERLSGVNAFATFEGFLNGDLFRLYVMYVLAPILDGVMCCCLIIYLLIWWLVCLFLFLGGSFCLVFVGVFFGFEFCCVGVVEG